MDSSKILEHFGIKKIGKGKYGIIYKLIPDKKKVEKLTYFHKITCHSCSHIQKKKKLVLKKIKVTKKITKCNIKYENDIHKFCFNRNPNLYVDILDFWFEEKS